LVVFSEDWTLFGASLPQILLKLTGIVGPQICYLLRLCDIPSSVRIELHLKAGIVSEMSNDEVGRAGEKRALSESHQRRLATDGSAVSDNHELSIGDIVRFLRDAFPRLLAGALIASALAVAAFISLRIVAPADTFFRTSLVITMNGAEPGKYPNGAEFSLTDLRSPVVLEDVFQTNRLSDYNITLADFLGMVSIEAYSPAYNSVTDRFRARLDNKTLTFEERKAIEAEFNSTLEGLGSKGVLVTFTVPESAKIPDLLAQKVVDDIPAKWAGIFIDRLGVANLPVPVSGTELVNVKFLADLDYPLAYDYLAGQATKLQSQLAAIEALPGSISFISSKSGKGIADIMREADAIEEYRLKLNLKPIVDQGLSRDQTVTVPIYDNKINSLEKDASVQSAYSGRVTTVISDFRDNNGTGSGGALSATAPPAAGTQFDGAFVDKIIELSKQGAGAEFEQELLRKKLEMENLNVAFTDQKVRMIERRNAIANNTLTEEVRKALEDKFITGLELATGELNQLWADSFEFLEELNNKRLNFDKALYRLNDLPDDKRVEKPGLLTSRVALILAAFAIFGAMAGFFSLVWSRAVKS
jgi:hypothetical protein